METKAGRNLKSLPALAGQTLRGYVKAAATALYLLTGRPCNYFDPATLPHQNPALHPYLTEQLSQRVAWRAPKPKKKPFTMPMFVARKHYLSAKRDPVSHVPANLLVQGVCML